MKPVPFVVAAQPFGARIEVNGDDVSDQVGAAEIRVANGQPTTLTLHLLADGAIEGEGIVHVVGHQPDLGDGIDTGVVLAFLESINPDQLEHDALMGADASQSLTAVMLETIKGYARGS